jgi:hypothetical protein
MLVELSVVEQRYHAVMEVISGASVTEVARRYGVSRQAVLGWHSRSLCWSACCGWAARMQRLGARHLHLRPLLPSSPWAGSP